MIVHDYMPVESLRPFINTYRIIRSQNELVNRVLPNTSLAIAFRYRGYTKYLTGCENGNLPASTISGLRKSVRLINYSNDTATIIVLFKETGAAAFFKEPLYEFFEESISIDNFIPHQQMSIIEERLSEAESDIKRIAIIENFFQTRLHNCKLDKLISTAVNKIYTEKGIIKIKELADSLYISNDAFEKRFRKIVGSSPKQFSYIVRLKSIITQGKKNQHFFDMAFKGGYYDQPHFNRDFKLFTGQTPSEFFKAASFW